MFESVSEHFSNLWHVKDEKLVFRARMHYFGVQKLWSIHSSPLDPKWCLCVFRMFSLTFGHTRRKTCVRAWMHYFGVPKLWSIHTSPLDIKWCLGLFRSISLTFGVYKMQNLYFGPECTISRYQNLWSIHSSTLDPKMMFGSVSEHFSILRHVKDAKLVFQARMHYLGVPKFWSIHSSPLDTKWWFWVFQMISLTFGTNKMKSSVRDWCTILWYQSCEASILVHWTQNDVCECFGAFR
jgi:hypothetical protein